MPPRKSEKTKRMENESGMVKLTFSYPKEIDDAIWEIHSQTRKNRTEIINEILKEWYKKKKRREKVG